jgi:hypothetical protein
METDSKNVEKFEHCWILIVFGFSRIILKSGKEEVIKVLNK